MDVDYDDEYVQILATAWHSKQCRLNHTDGCRWFYDSWETAHKWNRKHEYADKVMRQLQHAKDCGMTLQQFVDYERLGAYIEED